MYLLKFTVITLVYTLVSAQSWNPDYYPDYDNFQGGFHHYPNPSMQPNYNQPSPQMHASSNFYKQECECKRIKDCPQIFQKAYQSNMPLSDWLHAHYKESQCEYHHQNDEIVCCPYQQLVKPSVAKSTTEKPWIWDTQNGREPLKPTAMDKTRSKHQNKYKDDDYRFNLIDFEDPRTHKNCPPSFNDEFEAPKNLQLSQKREKVPSKGLQNRKQSSSPGNKAPAGQRIQNQNQGAVNNQLNEQNQLINRSIKKRFVNSPLCGVSVNTRIVGGQEISPDQFPWMARLAYRNRTSGKLTYRCAGSVISDRYIVTAAHCVTNLVTSLEVFLVRVGELDTIRNLDCEQNPVTCVIPQDYNIQQIIPHAQYDTPKYANDIALIRLMRPINATEIIPICLPIDDLSMADKRLTGKTGIIAGWGSKTSALKRQTSSLQYVMLPIVNRTICAASYAQFSANSRTPIVVSPAQICAQGMENMDACQGDSGGPLMIEDTSTNDRFTLLGLVSFGPRTCGVSNFPGVYTRISSYIDWLGENMEL